MVLMTVAAESDKLRELRILLERYGISLIHYRNPIKAMDNILETDPRLILYNLQDYPRHWKIMVKFLREDSDRDQCIFLLYSDDQPDLEEANKALFLGVNGIISEKRTAAELCKAVLDIYQRYGSLNKSQEDPFLSSDKEYPLGFVFRHPRKKNLVTGVLTRVSPNSASFKADQGHEVSDLKDGDELQWCTLKLENQVITVNARVISNRTQIQLHLDFPNPKDKDILLSTLQKI